MQILKDIPLFSGLNTSALEALASIAVPKTFVKDSVLFYQGDAPKTLYILTHGTLKLYKITNDDKEIILHHFTPTTLVAEAALLQQINYPATAVCTQDVEVLAIEYEKFRDFFLGNATLAGVLISSLTAKIATLEQLIERALVMDVNERILHALKFAPTLFTSMKHYEIAAMLHMTPETLSRTLKKLHENGIITKQEGTFVLT